MRFYPIVLLLFFPVLLLAQQPCECCDWQKEGDMAYQKSQYKQALAFYEKAQQSPDVAKCFYLDFLLARTRLSVARTSKKTGPEAEAELRRCEAKYDEELKKFQARADADKALKKQAEQADDDQWRHASQGGKTALEAYLAMYPEGRHTTEAREALTRLEISERGNPRPDTAKMAFVKGGTYLMGAFDEAAHYDEKPAHRVTVSSFYLSKTEVTFEEYDAFCAATGAPKPRDIWGRGQLPVGNVTWWDAVQYCNWRSEQEGLIPVYTIDKSASDPEDEYGYVKWAITANWAANGYRLPTEAEWEYAARAESGRGGGSARYGNGKNVAEYAGINCNLPGKFSEKAIPGQFRNKTLPVRAMPPNSLGLYHMSGNVDEWCWDIYEHGYYEKSVGANNPRGGTEDPKTRGSFMKRPYHVSRGGDYLFDTDRARTTKRNYSSDNHYVSALGFRLARNAE